MVKDYLKIIILLILIFTVSLFAKQKIISLASGYTYQLFKLNCGHAIIANTTYCNRPKAAQSKKKIGTIVNIDVEQIYAMQPDLVISSTLTRKKQIRKLQQLGIEVAIFQRPRSYPGLIEQYQKLAKYVDKQDLAQRQIDSINHKINSIQEQIKNLKGQKLFFQIGSNPLYAANGSSFINDLIKMSYCKNIIKTQKSGAFSREAIIAKDPDIIFIALNNQKNQIEKQKWQKFTSIAAVRKNRIYTVDPNIFCTPTPFTFARALEKMTHIIYPEVFQANE